MDSETETAKVLDTELRAELEREGVDAEAAKAEAEEGDGEDEEGNGKVGGGGGGKMSWGGLLAVAKIAGGAHHPGGALVEPSTAIAISLPSGLLWRCRPSGQRSIVCPSALV